ncbi:hypothetical protein [Acidovorax sp.]|uniref:hypothetical protein n=1 Tax=Acidovorax sp. TaxID=1872122 RepID=UPI003D0742E0
MKSSRTQLLARLADLERLEPGPAVGTKKPTIVIDMRKVTTISRKRWVSLGKAARNPALKVRSVANFSDD